MQKTLDFKYLIRKELNTSPSDFYQDQWYSSAVIPLCGVSLGKITSINSNSQQQELHVILAILWIFESSIPELLLLPFPAE